MRRDSDGFGTYTLPDTVDKDRFGLVRPSTAGVSSRRSSVGKRPATAGSRPTTLGGTSVGSASSTGSNISFLDRFTAADRKQQKLLMLQKKEDVQDALIKRAQIDGARPFTPELVREVKIEADRVVNSVRGEH